MCACKGGRERLGSWAMNWGASSSVLPGVPWLARVFGDVHLISGYLLEVMVSAHGPAGELS